MGFGADFDAIQNERDAYTKELLEELSKWLGERREAPDWTTIGMIQNRILEIIEREGL